MQLDQGLRALVDDDDDDDDEAEDVEVLRPPLSVRSGLGLVPE